MKALLYKGPKTLAYQDTDDPAQDAGENLIQIHAVGICGSDMHAYLGHDDRRPAPLILGHEAAGVVIEGPMKDSRVTINPLVACGECRFCKLERENICPNRQIISMPPRQGAFAEQVRMPSGNLVVVPDDVPFVKAALVEPLAVCWHAVRLAVEKLEQPLANVRCLVLGGGAIGVGSALCLAAMGARDIQISEPNEVRQPFLKDQIGLKVWDGQDTLDIDLIVDSVGIAPTRKQASAIIAPGGVIAHIGLGDHADGLDVRRMTLQEITFVGTYTYTEQDFRDTAHALFDGRLGSLDWVEERPLADGGPAFADILAGVVPAPKIVLIP